MPSHLNQHLRNISAGAAGASFVALTQLATRDGIDLSHSIAICCFSITLPIFVTIAIVPKFHTIQSDSSYVGTVSGVVVVVGIVFVFGVASLLWAFGWYFALAFTAICLACYWATA